MLVVTRKQEHALRWLAILTAQKQRFYTKYSSSDDEEEPKKQKRSEQPKAKAEKETAAARLHRLLANMPTDDSKNLKSNAEVIPMAKPGVAHKLRKEAAKEQIASKDVVTAAKRVALLLGEDNHKQTESELLGKLLGHSAPNAGTTDSDRKEKDTTVSKEAQGGELSISELIVGMKIDRSEKKNEETRSDFVRRMLAGKRPQQRDISAASNDSRPRKERPDQKRTAESYTGSVNITAGDRLEIFKEPSKLRASPDMLSTWAHLQQHKLQLQVTHPPSNYFNKIARWTEQGKVWRFPIDNEQDWSDEIDVDFSEHIFLEQHLDPWCPARGPIRHFMELVTVGLSKNPYITAAEKKEHILWYRDYFEGKRELLKDLISDSKTDAKSIPKSVKA